MEESRRSFLKKAGAGVALFTILPRHVLGAMGGDKRYVAPSDQLTKGIIGVGGIVGPPAEGGGACQVQIRPDPQDLA